MAQIIHSVAELQNWSKEQKRQGKTVGLVPTMGFLHAGHLSLIDKAHACGADAVAVSIFVNPTQFGPNEDYDCYPRDFEHDRILCEEHGADVIFAPAVNDMYPAKLTCWVQEEEISKGLCGRTRPVHFRGVTTVVTKLFLAALPDLAVFGQKDAQQAAIIKRMVRDLNFPIQIIVAPIVREEDGLALSSRNKYLSSDERTRALSISRSLFAAKQALESGERSDALAECTIIRTALEEAGGVVDYVEALDPDTMEPIPDGAVRPVLYAVACVFGKTRLIDNMTIQ